MTKNAQRDTERAQRAQEALARATTGDSFTNYPAIVSGFMSKGIEAGEITPRVNVFTFHAWKAKGRSVKKGETGVKVITYVEKTMELSNGETLQKRYPSTTTVFHISQTEPSKF